MYNKIILVGRLTKDPEMRSTPSGQTVASFSIAVSRKFARPGEERQTDFFDCVAWNKTAEFLCKYFQKGSAILVDGRIEIRIWEDKEGKKRYSPEVIASDLNFVESKKSQEQYSQGSSYSAPAQETDNLPKDFGPGSFDDDLPF